MSRARRLRNGAATALAIGSIGVGLSGAMAQDEVGSTVTIGGGTSGVGGGEVVVLAPGVTISGGEVINETGIGVLSGGGSSIGAAPGGGENATDVE